MTSDNSFMKICIIAIGKGKSGSEAELITKYLNRLSWQIQILEIEEKRPLTRNRKIDSEGQKLLAAIPKESFVVALDKAGQTLSSEGLAKMMDGWVNYYKVISFLIGGADGLSNDVLSRADYRLSLGAMTWPHLLARVMLIEQLYRAFAIREGHPYHK